jgi:regulator of protease activity HflC (stomatin/prohibitin superfamily)
MATLNPSERLLIENGFNHYQVIGPGWIWLKPWQRVLTKLDVGPQGQVLQFSEVRTVENVPVSITLQVLYQIAPELFTADLLPNLPGLNQVGWQNTLKWRTEHTLRSLLAGCTWRDLGREETQPRLERRLTQTLADILKGIGLKINFVYLVKTELPTHLQSTLVQTEQNGLESRSRALVLKEYFDLFGHNLFQVMPYIVQWELLNTMQKNGKVQVLLTSSALSSDGQNLDSRSTQPIFQMQLPLPQES